MDFLHSHKKILLSGAAALIVAASAAGFGLPGLVAGLVICAGIAMTVAIVLRPWAGLMLVAFFLPFERVGSIDIGPFTLRISQVLVLITIAATAWHYLRGTIRLRFRSTIFPLSVFFLGAAIALPFAVNSFRALTTIIFFVFTMSLVILIPTLLTSRQRMFWVVRALLVGAIITSLFGLFQFAGDLAGLPTSITGLRDLYTKDVFGFPRVQSTALEPLYYANYLLLPLGLSLAALIRRERRVLALSLVTLAVGLPVFVLTLSRAAYIAFAILVVMLVVLQFRQAIKPSHIVVFIMLGILTFYAFTYAMSLTGKEELSIATFTKQATDLFSGASYQDRVKTTSQAWDLFLLHPQGVGPGNFGPTIAAHPLVEPTGGWLIVNNIYLEILAEEGVLGLVGFLGFCIVVVWSLFSTYRKEQDSLIKTLQIATLAALCAIMAQYLTFSIVYIMHIWFAFGIAVALIANKQEQKI